VKGARTKAAAKKFLLRVAVEHATNKRATPLITSSMFFERTSSTESIPPKNEHAPKQRRSSPLVTGVNVCSTPCCKNLKKLRANEE